MSDKESMELIYLAQYGQYGTVRDSMAQYHAKVV